MRWWLVVAVSVHDATCLSRATPDAARIYSAAETLKDRLVHLSNYGAKEAVNSSSSTSGVTAKAQTIHCSTALGRKQPISASRAAAMAVAAMVARHGGGGRSHVDGRGACRLWVRITA